MTPLEDDEVKLYLERAIGYLEEDGVYVDNQFNQNVSIDLEAIGGLANQSLSLP